MYEDEESIFICTSIVSIYGYCMFLSNPKYE